MDSYKSPFLCMILENSCSSQWLLCKLKYKMYNFMAVWPRERGTPRGRGCGVPPYTACATGLGIVFYLSVLNKVFNFVWFCPKQDKGFKPSAPHLYPNIGQVPKKVEQSRDNLFIERDKASSTKVRTGYRKRLLPWNSRACFFLNTQTKGFKIQTIHAHIPTLREPQ